MIVFLTVISVFFVYALIVGAFFVALERRAEKMKRACRYYYDRSDILFLSIIWPCMFVIPWIVKLGVRVAAHIFYYPIHWLASIIEKVLERADK